MSDKIFLDLETSQAQDPIVINEVVANMKAPASYKKKETIEKWLVDNVASTIAKTSFDGWAGEIICIGFAVNDSPAKSLIRTKNMSEKELLQDFWNLLVDAYGVNFNPLWVAHNVEFDLPFLYKRMVVHNVAPPIPFPVMPKAWDKQVYCTMHNSTGGKPGGSLNRIAKVLGLGQKTEGIDGSQINQAWLDGRGAEIAEYNRQDVELCRAIYKRLTFTESLSETLNPLKKAI
ncbi:MAG: hypothetical protein GY694_08315 [Gammaproteobacteria bacterium]|nr:hypothetical protein [Gammaproteobacteria bacterium]